MRSQLVRLLVGGALVGALGSPVPASADHISITAAVGASISKLKPGSALLRVTWSAQCVGAAPGAANFIGNLSLLRPDTGAETYLGGVFGATGGVEQTVARDERDQAFTPVLTISCFEDGSLHGSGNVLATGAEVVVPARDRHGGGGGAGGGGGGGGEGGGDTGSGAPDDPLHRGGCADEVRGTPRADRIGGGPGGDLVFALGGADRVQGAEGHDCLIGQGGDDRLSGQEGFDRLTGGAGRDLLEGGPGANAYDAGPGRDRVLARNHRAETVRCGPGKDADARRPLRPRSRLTSTCARPERLGLGALLGERRSRSAANSSRSASTSRSPARPKKTPPVVAEHADRERVALRRERHERIDRLEPAAEQVERHLRAGDVGDDQIECQRPGDRAGEHPVDRRRRPTGRLDDQRRGSACSERFSRVGLGVDRSQPGVGIGLADRQRDEQGGDPVAELEVLVGAADAHRDEGRPDAAAGRLGATLEQSPQRRRRRPRG